MKYCCNQTNDLNDAYIAKFRIHYDNRQENSILTKSWITVYPQAKGWNEFVQTMFLLRALFWTNTTLLWHLHKTHDKWEEQGQKYRVEWLLTKPHQVKSPKTHFKQKILLYLQQITIFVSLDKIWKFAMRKIFELLLDLEGSIWRIRRGPTLLTNNETKRTKTSTILSLNLKKNDQLKGHQE